MSVLMSLSVAWLMHRAVPSRGRLRGRGQSPSKFHETFVTGHVSLSMSCVKISSVNTLVLEGYDKLTTGYEVMNHTRGSSLLNLGADPI